MRCFTRGCGDVTVTANRAKAQSSRCGCRQGQIPKQSRIAQLVSRTMSAPGGSGTYDGQGGGPDVTPICRTGRYGLSLALADHSGLMFATLTTLAHFSISSVMSFPEVGGGAHKG